ncbi:MAG: transporter substrate-binding domain-containing protein [Desulfamplus sp.]|nr:transporter substrate-binding domain-containing protein [Desulfamplus sp.]
MIDDKIIKFMMNFYTQLIFDANACFIRKIKSCALLWLSIFSIISINSSIVHSNELTITFVSEEWDDSTLSDGTGLYWDIIRAVFEPEGYKVITTNKSYAGSVSMVKKKAMDAMVGAYENEIADGVYPQTHFGVDVVQAVYKKGRKIEWKDVISIKNSTVAWIRGYSYEYYISEDIARSLNIRLFNNREDIFKFFATGKLDFYIDAEADITDFFKKHANQYQENDFIRQTFLELKLFVVFTFDERGRKLAAIFDRRMKELLEKGEIKKLYDKYPNANFKYPFDF